MTTVAQINTASITLPDAEVPEWIHLLPFGADGRVQTRDSRGPYTVADAAVVIANSFERGPKLPIDEAHATDKPSATEAPARGWIVEMEHRDDGIWGRVEWNQSGKALLEDRAYGAISPVTGHRSKGDKAVYSILRAALVNDPNLPEITRLNAEEQMNFMERLRKALNLAEDASEDAVISAIEKMSGSVETNATERGKLAQALGLSQDAEFSTVLNAAQTDASDIAQLQGQVTTLTNEMNALRTDTAKADAERAIDGHIKAGKPLVAQRARWIERHQADPEATEEMISGLPTISGAPVVKGDVPAAEVTELNASQKDTARLLGIDPAAYLETLKGESA